MPLALEERVARLERALGGDDAAFPTLVRLNADGTIAYDFDGHISADGIDMQEATAADPPNDHKIRWLEGATQREGIWGYRTGGGTPTHVLVLLADGAAGSSVCQLALEAETGQLVINMEDSAGTACTYAFRPNSVLDVFASPDNTQFDIQLEDDTILRLSRPGGPTPKLEAIAGSITKQLISSLEVSGFLQVNPAAKLQVSVGEDDLDLSGVNSATDTINHNLEDASGDDITPDVVVATPNTTGAICQTFGYTGTQFSYRIQHRDAGTNFGAGTTVTTRWIAIG